MPTEVTQEQRGGRTVSLVSVTPSQEFLREPATVYPVLIDPPLTRYKLAWTYVSADCGGCAFWNSSSVAQSGPIDGHTHISYFRMSMADLQYRTNIVSAAFVIDLLRTESGYWKETELWEVTSISSATSWNNRPGRNANLGKVVLNAPVNGVSWGVTDRLRYAASAGWPDWTQYVRRQRAGGRGLHVVTGGVGSPGAEMFAGWNSAGPDEYHPSRAVTGCAVLMLGGCATTGLRNDGTKFHGGAIGIGPPHHPSIFVGTMAKA